VDNTDPPPAQEWHVPESGEAEPTSERPAVADNRTSRRAAMSAAILAGGLIVGGGVGYAVGHDHGRSSNESARAGIGFAGGIPGGPNQLPDGSRGGPGDASGGIPGGISGEQHVQGTLTAKSGSKLTVKTSDGTSASYTVSSTTQIVRDGTMAALSDLKIGDAVQVHVIPASSGSGTVVERVFAGTSATSFGPGGLGGPPGDGQLGAPGGSNNDSGSTSNT
jgi:hypothetical protein